MKRYLKPVVMIMLAFSLAGCADQIQDEETQAQTLPIEESDAPLLAEGEKITIDGECEFQVDYVRISENPEHYYEAETGKTCVDFCLTYKNLADYTVNASNVMKGKLIYSGWYEYNGADRATDDSESSLSPAHWIDMEPSDTRQIHYFFAVPKELQDSGRMVELNVSIRENDYRIIVREGEKGEIPAEKTTSTSGEVEDGQVVVTDNAKFHVEYAEFTKEVIPPSPNHSYNYYSAEDGKVYIDFCVAYTNLSSQNITGAKAILAKLDQAEAVTSVTEQSERSMFDYSNLVNVIPLCTEYIHYIFQVPEELETSSDQVTISFKIDGSNYTYSVKRK